MRNAVRDEALIPPPAPALVDRFCAAFASLYSLAPGHRLGLAISGGPDSLALLLLAHAAFRGRVEAATVDHALRAESAGEAAMVAKICARLDVPHATLTRSAPLGRGQGVQAAAREMRYTALGRWCASRDMPAVLTGHHADDQAETLLMRLRRGAGIGGLGSIRSSRPLETLSAATLMPSPVVPVETKRIALVRPLLGFLKSELLSIVAASGLTAVDDPSNRHDGYDRTHARRLLAEGGWLDARRLAASAAHLADAEHALDWAAWQERSRRVTRDREQGWNIDPSRLPDEILRRIVEMTLADVERLVRNLEFYVRVAPPRGPELTRFIARLKSGQSATLGHVLARPGAMWHFSVAPPRRS